MLRITICPYCKDSVSELEAVSCPACDATHHPECWEANGQRCSVYGCESQSDSDWLGCPWCEEVYSNGRKTCMSCGTPLRTPAECLSLVERHEWIPMQFSEEPNALLTMGYLRNNGVIARISKRAPISMFRIGQRCSLWIAKEHEQLARQLMEDLSTRYTYCTECGHVLLLDEEECSYCLEAGAES